MQFIVAKDYAGLGFAVRLQEEGHQVLPVTNLDKTEIAPPRSLPALSASGRGAMVEKISLQHLLQLRSAFTDAYWIWDLNHSVDENEALHAEGFRVLGGGPHAYTVEHDRKACLDFVGRHGLEAPPSLDFERPSDAINCCAQHAGTFDVVDSADRAGSCRIGNDQLFAGPR